jgi:uncharacterized protein YeaC (DUF1315 family)
MSDDFSSVVNQLTPEIYQNMKRAVETGRWPDGRDVSSQQRAICLQAVIAWEATHLPEQERSGFIERKQCSSEAGEEQPVTLRGPGGEDA